MAVAHGLQISPGADQPALGPDQKRFNTLIRQIDQARRSLAAWRDQIPLYARAHVQAIVPLLAELKAARREQVFALDRLLDEPGWTRADRATLRELVCESAAELLDGGGDDLALKALFDKHAEVDFETERRQMRSALKDLTEATFGVDLGDVDDVASDEDLLRRVHEKMAAQAAERGAAGAHGGRPRRKTAAQQRREAEAQLATQSVREVFRKLAGALHPDREPDPAERDAKTALMQRVNQAYAAGDLLTLLELQLQIEQIDAAHLAGAGAQRIRHYNKVLAGQLAELKAETERTELGFCADFGLRPGLKLDPARIVGLVDRAAAELRAEIAGRRHETRTLADRAAAKRWIKRERQRLRDEASGDGFFF